MKRGGRSARRSIWERDGGVCQICSQPVAFDRFLHIDHLVPVHVGGCSHPENLRTTHRLCNLTRKDAWPTEAHCPLEPGVRRTLRVVGSSRGVRVERVQRSLYFDAVVLRWLKERSEQTGQSIDIQVRKILHIAMERETAEGVS